MYNTKNQFWAGLGSRASTVKKKLGADYEQLNGQTGKKNVKKSQKKIGKYFLQLFFRAEKFQFQFQDPLIKPLLAPTVYFHLVHLLITCR